MKRIIQRPWGRRRNGGWVIRNSELLECLKQGEAVQLDGVTIGTMQLSRLIKLLPYDYCQVKSNSRLEIETVDVIPRKGKDGNFRAGFRKPKHYHQWFALVDGAWLPKRYDIKVVVLKPRKL